jgi:hypothetical protein
MTDIIEKLTKDLLNKIITEFKKKENKILVDKELILPLIFCIKTSIINEFFPFILVGISIIILTFLFALIIMIILIRKI